MEQQIQIKKVLYEHVYKELIIRRLQFYTFLFAFYLNIAFYANTMKRSKTECNSVNDCLFS